MISGNIAIGVVNLDHYIRLVMHACVLSRFSGVGLFATLWTVVHLVPLSIGFSRQEYWGELSCSSPGYLLIQGSNLHLLCLLHWQAGSLSLAPPEKTRLMVPCGKMTFPSLGQENHLCGITLEIYEDAFIVLHHKPMNQGGMNPPLSLLQGYSIVPTQLI